MNRTKFNQRNLAIWGALGSIALFSITLVAFNWQGSIELEGVKNEGIGKVEDKSKVENNAKFELLLPQEFPPKRTESSNVAGQSEIETRLINLLEKRFEELKQQEERFDQMEELSIQNMEKLMHKLDSVQTGNAQDLNMVLQQIENRLKQLKDIDRVPNPPANYDDRMAEFRQEEKRRRDERRRFVPKQREFSAEEKERSNAKIAELLSEAKNGRD